MIYRRDGYRQFSAENGLPTVQINGVPTGKMPEAIDALVISLKTRSIAVEHSNRWRFELVATAGCKQIYFKYCSTFDSTQWEYRPSYRCINGCSTIIVYGLLRPASQRTYGLSGAFVRNESTAGRIRMRHHPVNPMTDSYLPVWLKRNPGRCGVVSAHVSNKV
ncbi:MAG: four-carbon acid sugar kinase family protein [Enterobacter hormaechei]